MVQCASSWLYVILSAWLKVSKSTRARMPEGQSLYHLKLIPRILMLLIYRPHISQSSHLQKQCQKNGEVDYNSLPLQFSTVTGSAIHLHQALSFCSAILSMLTFVCLVITSRSLCSFRYYVCLKERIDKGEATWPLLSVLFY